ncbi:signal peptidase I [Curtobacterium sp. MCBD17_013]|uniref:signal peptidase I n=1 Tax=Curtobacterium sp. MCBD17_013 TaxID=2175668 RepID=UPI000DA78789|nr:signal peptidase I [Curtobacterium sp. MCBD17_013]PZF59438.1 signal peptidase I [Curtobacterium sp. MCBD17_013]
MRASSWIRFAVVLTARGVIAAVIGMAFWAAAPLALGWHSTTVMTGSMEPALQPGDVVVSKPVAVRELRKGQVLLFSDPDHADMLRLHRFHALNDDGTLTTKGDANASADSTPITRSSVLGVGYLRVPLVGTPVLWMAEHRTGRVAALAVGLVVLSGLALLPAVEADGDASGRPSRRPHGRHRVAPTHRRTTAAIVATAACALVSVALAAPAAAASFSTTAMTGASSLATATATPATALTCTNNTNGSVTIGWTYTGTAPDHFTVLVDGQPDGTVTAPGARTSTLDAADFFAWKTSTVSIRTDLTDTWTTPSTSTVRITTIRLFGLGTTTCAR